MPELVQQTINSIISMITQTKAINTTAQSINPKLSCLQFGVFGGGPLKVS